VSKLTKSRHPAYHLRPNKAIDRLLFLQVMEALDDFAGLDDHTYIGFAGPFLEDARMVAQRFPKLRQISVELDKETHKRQKFHQCSRLLELKNLSFEEFLATSFPTDRTIVWADYTDMDRRVLLEVSDLARKSVPLSLLRVTFPAETPVYEVLDLLRRPRDLPKAKPRQFKEFAKNFADRMRVPDVVYDPSLFVWPNFTEVSYPTLLARMLESVIQGSCVLPKQFVPLHAAKYSDGTIMLSLTGVFCDMSSCDLVRKHFRKNRFMKSQPIAVDAIDIPVLTTKERLHLESLLPTAKFDGKRCRKRMGYLIEGDDSEELSDYKLGQYELYHRLYPYFGRLVP
jgi:hypothetical protein